MVVLNDVAALVMALPVAIMLRESQGLQGDRLVYILTCVPLLAVAALAAALIMGSYRAVWRYMGTGEIVRLAQFALLAVLLFWLGQFLVDRLTQLPRSGPAIHFLVAMFILIGSRIAYGKYCRWQESPVDGRKRRQPLLLIGTGDGTSLFIQMLSQRRNADYEPVGILADDVTRHRSINGVSILGGLADIDRVLAILRVQGMSPARIVVTRPHHELGRTAVQHVMKRADGRFGLVVDGDGRRIAVPVVQHVDVVLVT
jgi:FlaA1/EpsC-like NDP-sugar epimerase